MPKRKAPLKQEPLISTVIEAMKDKKAGNPVILDFRPLHLAVWDTFTICHGTSRTQVAAIADHVMEEVKKKHGIDPWHREGFENAEWILIDYSDVVVHVFQEERRKFYNLEQLWADAEMIPSDSMDSKKPQ